MDSKQTGPQRAGLMVGDGVVEYGTACTERCGVVLDRPRAFLAWLQTARLSLVTDVHVDGVVAHTDEALINFSTSAWYHGEMRDVPHTKQAFLQYYNMACTDKETLRTSYSESLAPLKSTLHLIVATNNHRCK